ncbi:MAG: thymidine phosphorylase, partial [Kiritimatiellae bacterium]|nr:thymidine phosphorylase [Kiritimatiellia bacterium]
VVLELGGGRRAAADTIDPAAGVSNLVQRGETLSKGDRLMTLHAATPALAESLAEEARLAVIM